MKYAIWNNKGGVGKSFLTFALATEYASQNPDKQVFVIDMCPQANVSEIILGGNGRGAEILEKLINDSKTIGGYFDERLESPQRLSGNETSFALKANDDNEHIPANLYLIAGDPSLEVQAETINQIASQTLPVDTWKNVHSWLKDLVQALSGKHENSTFFIDCNPSFAAYTELALVASDKLIIPCTADGSSARAIDNLAQLVYGVENKESYGDAIFSNRVKKEGLSVPAIHMVLLNRSTQYNNKASKAFGAMFNEITKRVEVLLKKETRASAGAGNVFYDIPDTHSVAIVASHKGLPINKIKIGQYEVHDQKPQVNQEPLDRYREAIENVASRL